MQIADNHPLSLGASVSQSSTQAFISEADVVLALGTELADTDCYAGHYRFSGKLIHVDIDPSKLGDTFTTFLKIHSDAKLFAEELLSATQDKYHPVAEAKTAVSRVKEGVAAGLADYEKEHLAFLKILRESISEDTLIAADMTQIAYSATALLEVNQPNCWFYPSELRNARFCCSCGHWYKRGQT